MLSGFLSQSKEMQMGLTGCCNLHRCDCECEWLSSCRGAQVSVALDPIPSLDKLGESRQEGHLVENRTCGRRMILCGYPEQEQPEEEEI